MPILIFKQWSSFSLLTWQACWPFHIWAKSWSSLCIYDQGWFKHYICFVHSFFTSLVIFIIFHFYIFRTKKGHWIILTRNLYHLDQESIILLRIRLKYIEKKAQYFSKFTVVYKWIWNEGNVWCSSIYTGFGSSLTKFSMYYGKPKNIIIFNNFKGIVSSKQPQTVTTIQNYYAIVMSSLSLFRYGK